MPPIHRIVLTGGPCAGKTTCLAAMTNRLESLGFRVFCVPEVATLLLGGGVSLANISAQDLLDFEGHLLKTQLHLEDTFSALAAASGQPAVVLCDRGTLDVHAYLPPNLWQALLDEHGWSEVALRDARYSAIIHLVSAADGAEAFYTTANNAARSESPDEARRIDLRLQQAWTGHPHLRVIDNATDFAAKVQRTIAAVCHAIGAPEPLEIERKFLLSPASPPPSEWPVSAKSFLIEQTYLQSPAPDSEQRVRRRQADDGHSTYTHTIKKPLREGQRVEIERPLSSREYLSLLTEADPKRATIRKHRHCFLWKNNYFEVDFFVGGLAGLSVLEIELDHPEAAFDLPPFLQIDREVTQDPAYTNYALSTVPQGS